MRPTPALFLLIGTACSSDPAGIWLLTLTPDEAGLACSETLTENFSHGHEPEDASSEAWWTDDSQVYAQQLAFVEILETIDQQAVLVWDDEAWPGAWNAAYWEFAWADSTESSNSLNHEAGYSFSQSTADSIDDTIDFTIDKDTATGELITTTSSSFVWEESDIWNEAVAAEIGQTGSIPSGDYLYELVPGAETETAVTNNYATTDCEANPCRMQLDTTCAQGWTFSAVRAQSSPETGYVELAESGQ